MYSAEEGYYAETLIRLQFTLCMSLCYTEGEKKVLSKEGWSGELEY